MNFSKNWENFLICFMVCIGILSLRFVSDYPEEIILCAEGLISIAVEIVRSLGLLAFAEKLSQLSMWVIVLTVGAFRILIGVLLLRIFRQGMQQGGMVLVKDPNGVIKSGLWITILLFLVTALFFYSIVGIPIGVLLLLTGSLMVFIGRIPLALYIGYHGELLLKIKPKGLYVHYFFGCFIMMLCESLYAFGLAFSLFVIPVLSVGIVFHMAINKIFYKTHFHSIFEKNFEKPFDRGRMRNIITKGIHTDEEGR